MSLLAGLGSTIGHPCEGSRFPILRFLRHPFHLFHPSPANGSAIKSCHQRCCQQSQNQEQPLSRECEHDATQGQSIPVLFQHSKDFWPDADHLQYRTIKGCGNGTSYGGRIAP